MKILEQYLENSGSYRGAYVVNITISCETISWHLQPTSKTDILNIVSFFFFFFYWSVILPSSKSLQFPQQYTLCDRGSGSTANSVLGNALIRNFDFLPKSTVESWLYQTCFPCSSLGKESACSAGDLGSVPGLGRSPGEGNGNPLQYPWLENLMDRGAWWAAVHGVAKSRARLSD